MKTPNYLYSLVVLIVSSLLWPVPSAGSEPTGEEIVRKSQAAFYAAGDAMKARIKMKLVNRAGKVRERDLTMLRKNTGPDEQRYFMYFHAPGDVRGTSFMVWKYPGRDDDRWLFLPSLKLVRRIAAKDSQSSFVGSDFTYEDISGRDIDLDRHNRVGEEPCGVRVCYVVESVPKGKSHFTKKRAWIDKETFLPIREEYFGRGEEPERRFESIEIQTIENIPTVTVRRMENLRRGHRTDVRFESVTYGIELPATLFSERSLRRPPQRWIQ